MQGSDKESHTVLVVDDEPEVRKLVAAMLVRNGYKVLSADTGENAIRLFRNNPDTELLLTDVVAPGMSGPMLVDHLRGIDPDDTRRFRRVKAEWCDWPARPTGPREWPAAPGFRPAAASLR